MTKTTEPNPASILARLRNLCRTDHPNLPANLMLLLYAQQGLLARLEISPHAEDFVLKGALSLFARFGNATRPTEDIDLAASRLPNTPEHVAQVIRAVCATPFPDGLHLTIEADSIRTINQHLMSKFSGASDSRALERTLAQSTKPLRNGYGCPSNKFSATLKPGTSESS